MKRNLKRLTAVLLAAVLLLMTVPFTAGAVSAEGPDEHYGQINLSDESDDNAFYLYGAEDGETDVVEGAVYDKATNTLTLTDLNAPGYSLNIFSMGSDFKICVKGSCALMAVYANDMSRGTTLFFTGDGTLDVNKDNKSSYGGISCLNYLNADLKINVDSTVNLNVYGSKNAMRIYSTAVPTAEEAMIEDGKPMPDVTGGKMVRTEIHSKTALIEQDEFTEYYAGYSVKRESDPDGIYSGNVWTTSEGEEYIVINRYVKLDQYDSLVVDEEFDDVEMTWDEFNKSEYSFVMAPKKTGVYFADDYYEQNRGKAAVKVSCASDPDGIYCTEARFDDNTNMIESDEYTIVRIVYDDAQNAFVKDTAFEPVTVSKDEMESKGYSIVYTQNTRNVMVSCYSSFEKISDPDSGVMHCDKVIKADAPDIPYVVTGTYTAEMDGEIYERGYEVCELLYDSESGAYYTDATDPERRFMVSYENFDNEYSYVTEDVINVVPVHYIDEDFEFEDYAAYGSKATKDGDPDGIYAVQEWYYGDDPDISKDPDLYHVCKLSLDETRGYYVEESSENIDFADFETSGYHFALEDQQVEFKYRSKVDITSLGVYVDSDGKNYLVREYTETVYDFSEDNALDLFGDKVYPVTLSDRSMEGLEPSTYTVEEEMYQYSYAYPEYHHVAKGSEPQTEILIGDVNNDGTVNGADAGLLSRYASGWKDYGSKIKNWEAADVNRDGSVNGADAGILSRYASGWTNYAKYIKKIMV